MNVTEEERATEFRSSRPVSDDSALGDILKDLFRNGLDLIRGEVRLAAAEMSWKFSKQRKITQLVAIGASVAYAGFLSILAALVIALSAVMPAAWAALVVGVAAILTGTIVLLVAMKNRGKEDFIPRRTIDTLKEDAKWMRNQTI